MRINDFFTNEELRLQLHKANKTVIALPGNTNSWSEAIAFIRFEEKREKYIWVHPDEIYFVISSDHYVKALVKCDDKLKWITRHSTLKEMLDILPNENFIRLNKFYILNLNYFSDFNLDKKVLHFLGEYSLAVNHRISPFICRLLKNTCT